MTHQSNLLTFSGMPLDRCSTLRKNNAWVSEKVKENNTQFIPMVKGKYLFVDNKLLTFSYQELVSHQIDPQAYLLIFLGTDSGKAVFVLDCSSITPQKISTLSIGEIDDLDLRLSLHLVSQSQAAILAYGKSLSYWHNHHQFCGRCGAQSKSHDAGHMRKCSSEQCQQLHFPRTDPVVIMLVEYQPPSGPKKCLLAEHQRLSEKVVSTLAGFIDPGEALEEAVAREVYEEAGVKVDKVQYMASQPWPFPGSLMIGFHAITHDPSLNIDLEELSAAHWFSADEIKSFDEWGDPGDNFQLPRRESIARFLIDQWVAQQTC